MGVLWITCFVFCICCTGLIFGSPKSCDEVRKVFQLRQIGPNQLLPVKPVPGSELQVCLSRNLTCCTKKTEARYQLAARRDIQNLLQASSSNLKLLISRNVAAFQEAFETLTKQAENHSNAVLRESYPSMADQATVPVRELFTDIGLFLLGSELGVDDIVQRFFDDLFPLVYNHLINPGITDLAHSYVECVRSSSRDMRPFGAAPGLLVDQITRSGVSGKLFHQALHLGIEVINTTDHLQVSRECRRALLKMQYCPHCQGLTQSQPCMGYCLNVMRGCLASMAEIDAHWREFVRSMEGLSARMQGSQDLEQVLHGVHTLIHNGVGYAEKSGPRLLTQVHRICGVASRKPVQSFSIRHSSSSSSSRETVALKASFRVTGASLALRRKEFLTSLRLHRTYYGGLADQLCVSELASGDGFSCWNGADIVKSYTLRVVGNGVKAQTANPEVKVKVVDPVISQIIDKLKHVIQLLQGKSIPKLGTLDQIETGSGDAEGRYSGDCDDEDGCVGSGGDEMNRKVSRFAKLNPNVAKDRRHHHHHPYAEDSELKVRSGSHRPTGALLILILPYLHILLAS